MHSEGRLLNHEEPPFSHARNMHKAQKANDRLNLIVFQAEDSSMFLTADDIAHFTGIFGFTVAMPLTIATYYQAFKTRQEARDARDGTLHSMNCLEFVSIDGQSINLVPLETLHSLPRIGDVVLLPGDVAAGGKVYTAAYRVESVEHIYTPATTKSRRPNDARLTKTVAQVSALNS
jgi:hypothetical protein